VNVGFEKTVGCEFKAHLEAMKEADTVIAVYDPDDPLCEREAAAVAVAEMLNRQVFTIDPKAIHLF
jgi:50S ribosomal subunit-associated GTPase HflX